MIAEDKQLEDLLRALKAIGYQSYQIKEIMFEVSNKKDISKMNRQEQELVKNALQKYLEFAMKCCRQVR